MNALDQRRVVIVGAGPVGLAAALFLVERGVPVLVLERGAALSEDMRASTFHPATLDMLAPSGIAATLIAQGHIARQWQYRRHETVARIVFDLGVLDGDTAHPFRLQCEQFRLTRAVVEKLQASPLFSIIFNAEVASVHQDDRKVAVEARVGGETIARYYGAYAVAADGGRSAVRKALDLPFDGETYPRTSITAVVDCDFEALMPETLFVNYVWTDSDHFSLMRVRDHWRVGFSPRPEQSVEEATSPEGVERRLQTILPRRESYRVVHVGHYSVHRRAIHKFNHGRVLFAGDAAHLNSPAGGMGMNSGVHDAHAVAEHLAEVLAGADPALLDRYDRRRRTIAVEEVQAQSDQNYKRHREKDPARREQIWRDLADIAADRRRMRDYLFRASMLASIEREASIV
jgi:3-(3-hydroxy-phenyl)propionate hydroxylase